MVLDCTAKQADKINAILERMQATGDIEFGYFATGQALKTCLLFDLESSQHLHFIDGDKGGLYSASKQLKERSSATE